MAEGSNPPEPAYSYFSGEDGMKKFAVQDHELVPTHTLLGEEEAIAVLEEFGIEARQLPKIHLSDPVAKEIGAKVGDVIKIMRKSPTAGTSVFYRLVID